MRMVATALNEGQSAFAQASILELKAHRLQETILLAELALLFAKGGELMIITPESDDPKHHIIPKPGPVG